MKKGEIIESVAAGTGLPKAQVQAVLDEFIALAGKQLKKGEAITLTGFGSFKPVKRAARVGRNPTNGASIKIAASKSVRFAIGAQLKAQLNPSRKG